MKRFKLAFENTELSDDQIAIDPKIVFDQDSEVFTEQQALEELVEEINNDFSEENKLADVVDGLSDVAAVADNIEEASPTEVALMQTAANMAVAGTDDDATVLLPATESIVNGKEFSIALRKKIDLAMESMGTAHLSIWKKIKNAVAGFFNYLTKLKNKIAEAKKAMEVIARDKPNAKFNYTVKTKGLGFVDSEFRPFNNIKELTAGLKKSAAQVSEITPIAIEAVNSAIVFKDGLLQYIKDKQGHEKKLSEAILDYRAAFFEDFSKLKGSTKSKSGNQTTMSVDFAIGGYKYIVSYPTEKPTEVSDILNSLSRYDHKGLQTDFDATTYEISFTGVTIADINSYISTLDSLFDTIMKLQTKTLEDKIWDAENNRPKNDNGDGTLSGAVVAIGVGVLNESNANRFKNAQASAIFDSVASIEQFIYRIMIDQFSLINKFVEEKNWKTE